MPDLSQRATGHELMDDLDAAGPALHQALRELDSINYVLGGNYVTLTGLSQLLDTVVTPSTPLAIADLGCGSGDMLTLIRRLLVRRDIDAVLTGIDANPNVVHYAAERTPPACAITYECINILSPEFRQKRYDIVTATLFLHHFPTDKLVGLFKDFRSQVRLGMVINDLHRHWLAYYSIKWLTRVFSRTPMVKHDAPLSVARGFTKRELADMLRAAGIANYQIRWRWAFRWQVVVRF